MSAAKDLLCSCGETVPSYSVQAHMRTHARQPAPQPAPSAATIAHAFEPPPRGTYACGLCGRSELHSDHPVHPAPAPSGDEAKVREIAERWKPMFPAERATAIKCIVEEAYAAGKADGAREAQQELARLRRIARIPMCLVCGPSADNAVKTGPCSKCASPTAYTVTVEQADAIARRGSEG